MPRQDRDDQDDGAGFFPGRLGGQLGRIVAGLQNPQNALPRLGRDGLGMVDDAGNGGDGKPRLPCDLPDIQKPHLPFLDASCLFFHLSTAIPFHQVFRVKFPNNQ